MARDSTLNFSNMISAIYCLFSLELRGESVIKMFMFLGSRFSSFSKRYSHMFSIWEKSSMIPLLMGKWSSWVALEAKAGFPKAYSIFYWTSVPGGPTIIEGSICMWLVPTTEGVTHLGKSSPEKPALMKPVPWSITTNSFWSKNVSIFFNRSWIAVIFL